jgi:hypothetical protein
MAIREQSVIAESTNGLGGLGGYDSMVCEGEQGELRLYLDRALDADELEYIRQDLYDIIVAPIKQDMGIIIIKFKETAGNTLTSIAESLSPLNVTGWQLFGVDHVPVWSWILGGAVVCMMIGAITWPGKR